MDRAKPKELSGQAFSWGLVAALVNGCAGSPHRAEPTAPPVAVPTVAAPAPAPEVAVVAPVVRCPLVPMQLVATTPRGNATLVVLDQDGTVRGPPELSRRPVGTFDERGCITSEDDVVVDWTASSELWMLRTTLPADGRRVGRFVIEPNGALRDGEAEPSMTLSGYEADGLCAGKLLVGVMHAMMAGLSMAVVDGGAQQLDPPADSACPDRHGSSSVSPSLPDVTGP